MNVAITGGAGFIGSHLVEALGTKGISITVVDDLSGGSLENIDGMPVDFCQIDIADPGERLHSAFSECDVVYHLAAKADIVPSIEHPRTYVESNVLGTLNVLEAAKDVGVNKLIYAASSSCYGIPELYPTREDAPLNPRYPYALTKRLGEELCLHWGNVYGLSVNSLRLFNVYGPRARTSGNYGAVLGVFLAQKLAGKPLTIVGSGEQKRDFIHVRDVAQAFMAVSESDVENQIFNVGSGNPVTVNHLADLIGGIRESIPWRPGEPEVTHADIEHICRSLEWSPKIALSDGIAEMLAGLDEWKDAPVWDKDSIHVATKSWFKYLG